MNTYTRYEVAVIKFLSNMRINVETLSLYADDDEGYFATCEITGIKGHCANCTALNSDGEQVSFTAGDWIIGGPLGKLAGYF